MPRVDQYFRLSFVTVAATVVLGACQDPVRPESALHPSLPKFSLVPAYTLAQMDVGDLHHNCAVRSTGIIVCWGGNDYGQAPALRNALTGTFTQADAGNYHSCGLRNDGVAECWGYNHAGQAVPTRTATIGSFTQVSAGRYHTCALRNDGVVECWGDNDFGAAPVTRAAQTGTFGSVSAGYNFTCALRSDGVVECWGANNWGQAPATRNAATGFFSQLSAGGSHACAVRNDGIVECWGFNDYGAAPATRAAAVGTFTQVGSGQSYHSCAVRTDGVVECWGTNAYGGAPATRAAQTGSFVSVGAGYAHTCALRDDGVAECWGSNFGGESNPPPAAPLVPGTDPQSIAFTSAPPSPAFMGNTYEISATGGGSGTAVLFSSLTTSVCPITGSTASLVNVGTCTIAADQAGNDHYDPAPQITQSFSVVFAFSGFFSPVDNLPTVNSAQAGSAIPVKFNLGGDKGLSILAQGSPSSTVYTCNTAPLDAIEETVAASTSSLRYDGLQYIYVWKTDKAWARSCRQFLLKLADGTTHRANFQFR
jgi:alpha-tubulin suppressor-like RCC1 family protein